MWLWRRRRVHLEPGAPKVPGSGERFIKKIQESGALPDGLTAADAASAVLCVLLQRLSRGQAEDFVQSTPDRVQSLLWPCLEGRAERPEVFGRDEFLRRVSDRLAVKLKDAEAISRVVFDAVQEIPSAHPEIDDVESQLPPDMKELWRPERAHVW